MRALLQRVVPQPGKGPSERALDAIGYGCRCSHAAHAARASRPRHRRGPPGYRSTPEMAVCAALGLADGTLGRTPHYGIVSPAAGLGIEAVAALREARLHFQAGA